MTITLILISLAIGISLGFFVFTKHQNTKGYINYATTYTIYILIFSMGLAVGVNKPLLQNIVSVGWQAIFIAGCAMLGSILASIFFFRYITKKTNTK